MSLIQGGRVQSSCSTQSDVGPEFGLGSVQLDCHTELILESGAHIVPVERVAAILSTLPTKGLMLQLVKVSLSRLFCFCIKY